MNSPPIVLLFRRCAFDPIKLRQLSELLAKEVEVRHEMPCHPEGGGLRPKLRRGRPGRRGARSGGRHMPGTYAMYVSGERPCGRRASAEAFSHLWRRD